MKHTLPVLILAISSLLMPSRTFCAERIIEIVSGSESKKISLGLMKKKLKVKTLSFKDPVYGGKLKTYLGFDLNEVLLLGGFDPSKAQDEMVFTCKDGYSPSTPYESFKKNQAILAFSEKGKANTFMQVNQGKAKLSPEPFYLVWNVEDKLRESLPAPYQLVKIEAVHFESKYPKIFPVGKAVDSAEYKGFQTFKGQCLRCHSINLQGGDLGPELNIPKNILEYRDQNTVVEFIKNASQFRAKSKMPTFSNLTDEELENLISYLKWAGKNKS